MIKIASNYLYISFTHLNDVRKFQTVWSIFGYCIVLIFGSQLKISQKVNKKIKYHLEKIPLVNKNKTSL